MPWLKFILREHWTISNQHLLAQIETFLKLCVLEGWGPVGWCIYDSLEKFVWKFAERRAFLGT